jgi:predicted transcriptional regulator
MKVEIDKFGTVIIIAETNEEAFALKYILEDDTRAPEHKVLYDMRILDDQS